MTGVRVLVFGATGYIGANLVPRLLRQGHAVRASGRNRKVLEARDWARVELVEADARHTRTLPRRRPGHTSSAARAVLDRFPRSRARRSLARLHKVKSSSSARRPAKLSRMSCCAVTLSRNAASCFKRSSSVLSFATVSSPVRRRAGLKLRSWPITYQR